MFINKYYRVLLCFIIFSCSRSKKNQHPGIHNRKELLIKKETSGLPAPVKKLKNLTIYSADMPPRDTVLFKKVSEFKSAKNAYINGLIGKVAIDNQNRVYISATKPHAAAAVYVFHADGHFISKIGGIGKGPGEFLAIGGISIRNNKLYVYDSLQRRISVFLLDGFSLTTNYLIKRDRLTSNSKLTSLVPGGRFTVEENGTILMDFINNVFSNQNRKILYYKITKDGYIKPGQIIDLKSYSFYLPKSPRGTQGSIRMAHAMPFSRSSLVTASNKNIYTAWTENFLIKIYSKSGTYQRAFYYSYQNSLLSISDVNLGKGRERLVSEHKDQVPNTWPALHTMFIDDQNRLWIFTITDSKTHYKGWVLNEQGKLLAKFNWPGKRAFRSVMVKPLIRVKNGYLYSRERNLDKGIDKIVKYKINFKRH